MLATTADALRGLEFDWRAVDADRHVAFLSTAGGGAVPVGVDPDARDAAIDAILSAPAHVLAAVARDLRADVRNPWREVADWGAFGFDSTPVGGPS